MSDSVTHIHVKGAIARRHELEMLVSQTDREICLERRVILIKISIFGDGDLIIMFQESG